jgi:hypothetical protein
MNCCPAALEPIDRVLLQTPSFAQLFLTAEGIAQSANVDLAGQIVDKSEGDARVLVAALVASEVARIFRLSADEIDVARPLDEWGMD